MCVCVRACVRACVGGWVSSRRAAHPQTIKQASSQAAETQLDALDAGQAGVGAPINLLCCVLRAACCVLRRLKAAHLRALATTSREEPTSTNTAPHRLKRPTAAGSSTATCGQGRVAWGLVLAGASWVPSHPHHSKQGISRGKWA